MNLRSMAARLLRQPVPLQSAAEAEAETQHRSIYERFAVPYKFQPDLSVSGAAALAFRALLRIFLGSALFGLWGACSMWVWFSIPNLVLRTAMILPMAVLFVVLLAAMMMVTARPLHRLPR